jgi:hypothetical protein
MRRHVEVKDAATAVLEDEPGVKQAEPDRGDDEEVHTGDSVPVVSEKGPPALPLALVGLPLRQVARDGREAHGESQLFELRLDLAGAPRILCREPKDQLLQLLGDARPSRAWLRDGSPSRGGPFRCQRTTVPGVTMQSASFHRGQSRDSTTQKARSSDVILGLDPLWA